MTRVRIRAAAASGGRVPWVQIATPAKVNLALRVLGRREDGYHDLDTVMVAVEEYDRIEVRRSARMELQVEGLPAPSSAENLCWRAAESLLGHVGEAGGVAIRLVKRIPLGAGLGGGSGNAAGVLLGCDRLLESGLGADGLAPLARALGADVPFFLRGGLARCQGIGERVSPVVLDRRLDFLILTPPVNCSTAAVYRKFDKTAPVPVNRGILPVITGLSTSRVGASGGPKRTEAGDLRLLFQNDLESAALDEYPDLASVRNTLLAAGIPRVTLSGSGSSFFALAEDEQEARRWASAIRPLGLGQVRAAAYMPSGPDEDGRTPLPARES